MSADNLITIIGWVVTFALGVLSAVLVSRRTRKTRRLRWGIESETELVSSQVAEQIGLPVKILIGGREAESLTVLRFFLESLGNEVVERVSPLLVFNPECQILHVRPVGDLGEFSRHFSFEVQDSECRLSFDFLNPGTIVAMEFLLSSYDPGSVDFDLAAPGVEFSRTNHRDSSAVLSQVLRGVTIGLAGVKLDATVQPLAEIAYELNSIRRYMRHVDASGALSHDGTSRREHVPGDTQLPPAVKQAPQRDEEAER